MPKYSESSAFERDELIADAYESTIDAPRSPFAAISIVLEIIKDQVKVKDPGTGLGEGKKNSE